MNAKTIWALLVVALIAASAWYHAHQTLDEMCSQGVGPFMDPILVRLEENQGLIKELQTGPFAEQDSGILESYLAKIRRDGVSKNAAMKQRLDQLAENNTAIVALIQAYSPHAKTTAFTTEADKFRNYASAWRDRWNSVMEIFMAGGNYPASEIPFPKGFEEAVKVEAGASR
jgi:hypothetical protein